MTDEEVLQRILGHKELENFIAPFVKRLWRSREVEFFSAHNRLTPCSCLFYRAGDYMNAYEAALTHGIR